jgi:hypothetical protein
MVNMNLGKLIKENEIDRNFENEIETLEGGKFFFAGREFDSEEKLRTEIKRKEFWVDKIEKSRLKVEEVEVDMIRRKEVNDLYIYVYVYNICIYICIIYVYTYV